MILFRYALLLCFEFPQHSESFKAFTSYISVLIPLTPDCHSLENVAWIVLTFVSCLKGHIVKLNKHLTN